MAKYSDIKGFTVQTVSTDPVASQGAGGTWSSGGDMNTARIASTGTSSSSTNSIIGGGYYLPPTVNRSVTEAYDGSTWSELSDHPVSIVYGNGLGVKTAALIAGIDVSAAPTNSQTYIFDGSSWSTPGASINTMKFFSATGGTTTAGIIAGGNTPPATATTETWNGSSWTETTDLNTGKTNLGGGTGTSTALMAVGGTPATIEVYDGSSWTEIAEMNTSRDNTSKGGIVTAAIVTNGYAGSDYPAQTELYNGTSWTEVGDTPIGIGYASNISSGQPGGQTDGVVAGGQAGTVFSATTLEWSAPATFTKQVEGQLFFNSTTNTFKETVQDVAGGTWASGGALNTARGLYNAMNGTQSASKACSGLIPGDGSSPAVEDYNGSSWTETTEMSTARYSAAAVGATSASSLVTGGYIPSPPSFVAITESWNGSAWTEVNDLNTARGNISGFGIQTSALVFGSYNVPQYAQTESWDGTSWTEVGDLNQGRMDLATSGASNASGLGAGGEYSPNVRTDKTETWNGSSWTEVNDLNTGRAVPGGSGTSVDLALAFGGTPNGSTVIANTEFWNGSSWTEIADLGTARRTLAGSGTANAALAAGGVIPPSMSALTEEFTAGLSNKTITAS